MDGDTDVPSVQQDFAAALYQLMHRARRKEETNLRDPDSPVIKRHPNGILASNERAIPNGDAKSRINGVGKVTDARNGIVAQGKQLLHLLIKSIFSILKLSSLNLR